MGAGPDPAPTLSLDPPLYVLRLWGLASYNPQTLFAAKGLLSGNSLDGTPKERGNGHTTLKCKIKYKSVPPLPVSAAFFVV